MAGRASLAADICDRPPLEPSTQDPGPRTQDPGGLLIPRSARGAATRTQDPPALHTRRRRSNPGPAAICTTVLGPGFERRSVRPRRVCTTRRPADPPLCKPADIPIARPAPARSAHPPTDRRVRVRVRVRTQDPGPRTYAHPAFAPRSARGAARRVRGDRCLRRLRRARHSGLT